MSWFEERSGLAGTVAVVTGGAGGLGKAVADDLAANGVRVAVLDRAPSDAELAVVGDVREPAVLQGFFEEVDGHFGRLDTLVNVVGGTFRAPFAETTPKGWDALIRSNLTHVLHACSMAIPRMREGGSIVNLTTIEAHRAAPGFAVYAAAKAAVEQFARTLAVEVAPRGIRVNNVAPDYVPTPSLAVMGGGSPTAIPMGRPGRPEDVSNSVVFLASNLSSYITGTTLHPDGGTSAHAAWLA